MNYSPALHGWTAGETRTYQFFGIVATVDYAPACSGGWSITYKLPGGPQLGFESTNEPHRLASICRNGCQGVVLAGLANDTLAICVGPKGDV